MILLLLLALIIFAVVYWKKKQNDQGWKYIMEIPGPEGYPVIGTEYEFLSPESQFVRDTERAKEFYPLYKLWSFSIASVFVYSPEDIELILKNTVHNAKSSTYDFLHDWLGTGLLTSGGEKWHKRRKIITPAFHFNILQEFIGIIHKQAQFLVKTFEELSHEKPYVNITKPLTDFTLASIGETAMGISLREDPKSVEYGKALYDYSENYIYTIMRPWLYFDPIYKLSSAYKTGQKITKILHDFSNKVIKEKIEILNKGELTYTDKKRLALLDLLLKAKMSGADIDDAGIREEIDTFIFAGHDTTSLALTYQLFLLANNPEHQEEMYEEIISVVGETEAPDNSQLNDLKFMERCIKEGLRLYPSAPIIGRIAGEDIQTKSGYIIPKGCEVNLSIIDLHWSEKNWENPEIFDPDRFLPENVSSRHPFAFIPFSAGSRNCIGQKFAMLEMKVALCEILRKFKLLPYDRREHLRLKMDLVLRALDEVRVTFVPRK